MKKNIFIYALLISALVITACGDKKQEEEISPDYYQDVAFMPDKDLEIQRYNLEVMKSQTSTRTPCDTIALMEFVLDHYPEGTYLVHFDRTVIYSVFRPAVLYYPSDRIYVFGVIAKSRPGERVIEVKNIVGYDQSFIDLDSTELGTAFFYLTLFQCLNGNFSVVWEAPIPSHGGFNNITLDHWDFNRTPYIRVNFHYGQGIGHINYNYFLVNGLTSQPHLLMTYKGINFQRTIANVNNDKYPDYYEYLFYDLGDRIIARDSIAFVWSEKDSVYYNTRNRRQIRLY